MCSVYLDVAFHLLKCTEQELGNKARLDVWLNSMSSTTGNTLISHSVAQCIFKF